MWRELIHEELGVKLVILVIWSREQREVALEVVGTHEFLCETRLLLLIERGLLVLLLELVKVLALIEVRFAPHVCVSLPIQEVVIRVEASVEILLVVALVCSIEAKS